MKNQSFLLLIIFSWLFLSACEDTPPPITEPINPCRPYKLTMTKGFQGLSFQKILFFDARGTDTIQIEKKGPWSQAFEYQIIEYDSSGLPSSLTRYDSENFDLQGSYQITWWEEGIKKEIIEYDEQGAIRQIDEYNQQQHWTRSQSFFGGNLARDFTYINTYNSDDLLLSSLKYNTLTNDTSTLFTATYDSEGKQMSLRYENHSNPQTNYTLTYEYDVEDRVILELYVFDNSAFGNRVEIEYLNGELAFKRKIFDVNNEPTTYELHTYDEFKNLLMWSTYRAKTDELISSFEYDYICD